MSIDWDQIEAIVRDDPRRRTAGPGRECPAPEELVQFVEGNMGRKARAKTMEHLAGCVDCARIVQSLLRLSQEVDRLTGASGAVQSRPPGLLDAGEGSFGPPAGRRLALAGLASLIVLAAISVFMIRLFDRSVVRGPVGPKIKLIDPKKGETIPARNVMFRWEAVPQASGYFVDLFGRSLEKIFSSEPVSGPSLELPAAALRALVAGETYFWRVRAVMKEGEEAVSKLSEFSIRK